MFFSQRLYTGPKDEYTFNVLSGPAYKNVMENNVNLKFSFNEWDVSKERALKEPKKAYFSNSESSINYKPKYKCKVNFNQVPSPWTK